MSYLPHHPFAQRIVLVSFLALLACVLSVPLCGQAPPSQDPQAAAPAAQTQPQPAKPQEQSSANNGEVSSRDTPPTFKVRVNLVLVRVVVRDPKGNVVPDLHKEDFQLFDNRKPQTITTFSVETQASHAIEETSSIDAGNADPGAAKAAVLALPQRFVSVVVDDQHLVMTDLMFVRNAANKFLDSLAPSDRVGIYSTSGQLNQEFTSDHELLKRALLGLLPRSPTQGLQECPDISYYEADLIENQHDTQAASVAAQDYIACSGLQGTAPAAQLMSQATTVAQATATMVVGREDSSTEYALRHMEDIMRRLAGMPGQRIMVFVSPGFLTSTLHLEFSGVVDRATKSNIVINTIDARGLYTPDLGDIADPYSNTSVQTSGIRSLYATMAQTAQEDVLQQFADGTGGTFFHNRNDIDEGLRRAAAAPALTYLLGFSPQNLKLDGSMHTLKVSFTRKTNYQIQARHAYFAPRHVADPAEEAKLEIQEAIFSQDEIHDLPVDVHTQFFKTTSTQAKLAVVTHVEIKGMHFRKADGRNKDDITVATAIFDENGNYITGGEKIVEMKLLDTTYDKLTRSGLNLKSSFDVKPGSYLVRQVVRDSEGAQLAARNGAVVIPY
jgi:VWFA-related protein